MALVGIHPLILPISGSLLVSTLGVTDNIVYPLVHCENQEFEMDNQPEAKRLRVRNVRRGNNSFEHSLIYYQDQVLAA